MAGRGPSELALVRPLAQTSREQDALIQKVAYCAHGAAGALEGVEYQPDRGLHLSVGIEVDGAVGPANQAYGRGHG